MKKKTDAWKRRVAAGLLSAGAVGGAYLSSNPTSPPQAEKTKDSEVDRILALADEMMKSNERKRDLPISARNWFLTSRSDKALEAAGKTFEEARAKAHELHAEAEDAKTEFQQLRAVLTRAFVHASPQVREAVIKRLKDDDRVDTTDTLPEVTMGVSERNSENKTKAGTSAEPLWPEEHASLIKRLETLHEGLLTGRNSGGRNR